VAKDTVCHPLCSPVMQRFVENIEKAIASTPVILSSNIQKQFGPDNETVYLRGNLLFTDFSVLEIAIFAARIHNAVSIDKYRFHYKDKQGHHIYGCPRNPEFNS